MLKEPEFVQQIVDMYSSGKNQKEIVETTGETYFVVRYWLKKKGVFDPGRRQTGKVHAIQGLDPLNQANIARKRETENKIALFLLGKGVLYIGGYDGKYSTLKVACQKCGKVFSQYYDPKVLFKREQIDCPCCKQKEREIKQAQEEAERAKKREAYEKQLETWRKAREERELEKQHKLDEIHICKECNRLYTYRFYAQQIGVDPIFVQNVNFCSKECKRKYEHKHYKGSDKHKERCDKWGLEYDPTVNLDEMINRFGLRCSICGGMCDRSDVKVRRNGARIYGNNYPSIDHIVPLALKIKGHTWDNVQVAHRGCNSRKGKKVAA